MNLKTFFNFGHITIFEEGKRNGFYKGDLVSLESLNQHMDWTSDYFKRLRACLEEQRKEVTYSFISGNEDDPDNQTKFFKIIFKISKGADIIGMNVKCSFISTNKVLENLMNEMTAINQTKKKSIKDLEKKIENLETEKMVILENMNDVAQAKEQVENELLDKFTVILNEKKKKIASLQQEIDGYKNVKIVQQRDPVTGIVERVERRDTKLEEEVPTQLTTYQLDINGSQFDWIREPKVKDKRNVQDEILSRKQTEDHDTKIEPEIEIYDKAPVIQKKKRGPDLEDLFKM